MKRLLILTICLFSLAGCVLATRADGMLVATETATAAAIRLPLILKQETPTPTPTPTPTLTPTPPPQTPYGLPDLTIPYGYRIVYDDHCPWSSPGTITVTVQNIGTNHAGPFVAAINGQETSFSGLSAGGSTPLVSHFTSGLVGRICAEVDTQDQVVESNEDNNIVEIIIWITPPPPCYTLRSDIPSPTPIYTPSPLYCPTPVPTTSTPEP